MVGSRNGCGDLLESKGNWQCGRKRQGGGNGLVGPVKRWALIPAEARGFGHTLHLGVAGVAGIAGVAGVSKRAL
ncbi:MAG: hypothetical protein M1834_003842 [Cirrosporium novae-zelandiae]|nr:MAG: hypothetical protein M1834_003842 [Cirrosporium novae-zelandiae]